MAVSPDPSLARLRSSVLVLCRVLATCGTEREKGQHRGDAIILQSIPMYRRERDRMGLHLCEGEISSDLVCSFQ